MLIKDIKCLEQIQCPATKFILNSHYTNYRSRLLKLHLLPLVMTLELQDILFFVRSSKQSALNCSSFNISQYTSFSSDATRSGSHSKLVQPFVKTDRFKNYYFNHVPLLWNALPPIDFQLSYESRSSSLIYSGTHSFRTSTATTHAHTTSPVHVVSVHYFPNLLLSSKQWFHNWIIHVMYLTLSKSWLIFL